MGTSSRRPPARLSAGPTELTWTSTRSPSRTPSAGISAESETSATFCPSPRLTALAEGSIRVLMSLAKGRMAGRKSLPSPVPGRPTTRPMPTILLVSWPLMRTISWICTARAVSGASAIKANATAQAAHRGGGSERRLRVVGDLCAAVRFLRGRKAHALPMTQPPCQNRVARAWNRRNAPLRGPTHRLSWPPRGRPVAAPWPPRGRPVAAPWPPRGRPVAAPWPPRGRPVAAPWPPRGRPVAAPWPPRGRPVAAPWPLKRPRLDSLPRPGSMAPTPPLSAAKRLVFPLSTSHFPLLTFHFPLPTFHFPLSTFHFPLSTSTPRGR